MKFNTLLLLLTTFTAVVSSQFGQSIIQSLDRDLYWGVNGTCVALYPGGVRPAIWTIIILFRGISINIDNKSVQYNGDDKQLTIEGPDGDAQLWQIEQGPVEGSFFICSYQYNDECATAVEESSGWPKWAVKAEIRTASRIRSQLWKIHRILD